MRKISIILIALTSLLLWLTPVASAQTPAPPGGGISDWWYGCSGDTTHPPAEADWKIKRYETKLLIKRDGVLSVTERISVDYQAQKHGIYRYIPLLYSPRGEGYLSDEYSLLTIKDIVVQRDGAKEPVAISTSPSSQCIRAPWAHLDNQEIYMRIGDPAQTITGEHTYTISYTVYGALRGERGVIDLYWNALPHYWSVPIETGEARVEVEGMQLRDIHCYTGAYSSGANNCIFDKREQYSVTVKLITQLAAYEGMSILAELEVPLSQVAASVNGRPRTLIDYLARHPLELLSLVPLIVALIIKYRHGRGPASRGIIAPRYSSPSDISAAQAGTVLDQSVDSVDISAIIIALATKGYLTITQIPGTFLGLGRDYVFKKLTGTALMSPEEKLMYEGIFGTGSGEIKLSELKYDFATHIAAIKESLLSWGTTTGVFRGRPQASNSVFVPLYIWLAGIVIIGLVTAPSYLYWVGVALSVIGSIVTIMFFQFYTPQGKALQEEIAGLRMYLSTAERDRLEYHHAPERTPALYERLLPYAMSLGVVEAWTKQFTDLLKSPPSWYSGPLQHGVFVPGDFAHSMQTAAAAMASDMSATRSSSTSGGSSSGGGFSGGGGGGGGGGSW